MIFSPRQEYIIIDDKSPLYDFFRYKDEYITRPAYQRKSVWPVKKQQGLFDSLIRRYYVPRLVIREVRLSDNRIVKEVIDGQQRVTAIQDFYENKFRLPTSLKDVHPELVNKLYSELPSDLRRFIDDIKINLDIVKNIDDPKNPEFQKTATEIFWRLQQGEALNFMEIAHAKLSSLSRNFVVKYSDDESFDYSKYTPIDNNVNKHKFFRIIERKNDRMQHLTLMTRFLIIEELDGYADVKDSAVVEFINKYNIPDGIGNDDFENEGIAKNCLKNLDILHDIFRDDPIIGENNGVKELSREYLIISLYLLVRHLKKYYIIDETCKNLIGQFFYKFYERWNSQDQNDSDISIFSNNRQQSQNNLEVRDMIFRQLFFGFLKENEVELIPRDANRNFNEADKILIYRRDKGLCQDCLKEGKPEKEALVSWGIYQADHIFPHAKGGETTIGNAQVLCKYHNQKKGARVS